MCAITKTFDFYRRFVGTMKKKTKIPDPNVNKTRTKGTESVLIKTRII